MQQSSIVVRQNEISMKQKIDMSKIKVFNITREQVAFNAKITASISNCLIVIT